MLINYDDLPPAEQRDYSQKSRDTLDCLATAVFATFADMVIDFYVDVKTADDFIAKSYEQFPNYQPRVARYLDPFEARENRAISCVGFAALAGIWSLLSHPEETEPTYFIERIQPNDEITRSKAHVVVRLPFPHVSFETEEDMAVTTDKVGSPHFVEGWKEKDRDVAIYRKVWWDKLPKIKNVSNTYSTPSFLAKKLAYARPSKGVVQTLRELGTERFVNNYPNLLDFAREKFAERQRLKDQSNKTYYSRKNELS